MPDAPLHRSDSEDGVATDAAPAADASGARSREVDAVAAALRTPRWLRDLGVTAWSLVGAVALLVGFVWLLGEIQTIVNPLAAALIVAVVGSPVVGWLQQKGAPRWAGALLMLVSFVALGVVIVLLVVGGITSQSDTISATASSAADTVQTWLTDAGVNESGATGVSDTLKQDVPQIVSTLAHGVLSGIQGITSMVFALSFAALGLFFFLKDGPVFRSNLDRHMGVPLPIARVISGDLIGSLRRYFLGVTLVALFNAVVVGLGAWLLGVPLAGTIAVVTLVTAYIPYIGAVVSGAFAVTLALGSQGTTTALAMLVIVILANGMLQNVFQPIAFGATLNLNPLVVLFVTISAGCLFGMIGMVLAAPLTSAAVHIAGDLGRARREEPQAEHRPSPAATTPA
jgi:predicted PurR-regulated permease PerM